MAPVRDPPESFYLPPLDRCFRAGHRLISWRVVFETLSNLDLTNSSQNLESFLLDDLSVDALSSVFDPPKTPSSQSKSDFETRTAEINVTPKNDKHLDTKQIKEDALWLSDNANVDEVLALRIAVLEWQNRPTARIVGGYSEEELISLTKAIGTADFGVTASNLRVTSSGDHTKTLTFDADDSRHVRLLQVLLSEKEHLLKVSVTLRIVHGLRTPTAPPGRTYGLREAESFPQWINTVVEKVKAAGGAKAKQAPQSPHSHDFVIQGVEALSHMLSGWEAGSKWTTKLADPIPFELHYRDSQLRQMVLMLQLITTQLFAVDKSPLAGAIQAWFEFVDKHGFFELLQAQTSNQTQYVGPFQALVSLVTLQLLRLPHTIAYLNDQSALDRPPAIIHDASCRTQINQTISNAADRLSSIASPAIFAWSMILQTLRTRVNYATEDTQSDDDASFTESGSSPVVARRPSASVPAAFVDALESVVHASSDGDPVEKYAKVAADGCSVLDVIAIMSRVLGAEVEQSCGRAFKLYARLTLLELARLAVYFIDYKAETLECVLAILNGDPELERDGSGKESITRSELASAFMNDNEILVPRLLHQAYGRYPYETAPLLKLCKALVRRPTSAMGETPIAQPLCDPTPYFTQQLPKGFNEYELVREDENANGVRLTENLPLISHRRSWRARGVREKNQNALALQNGGQTEGEFYIPFGTTGTVLSESKPFVIAWDHTHSPLRYLACLLATATASSDRIDVFNDSQIDDETQADVISIFSQLLDASGDEIARDGKTPDASSSRAMWVLEEASDILERNQDVVSVIFEIFERELSQQLLHRREGTLMILTSCVDFFRAASKVVPGRIWPLLARSELLEFSGRGGRISAIISAESSSGSCTFTTACLSLFETLTQDVVRQAVSGRVPSAAVTTRFSKENDSSPRLPKKLVGEIILSLTHTFANVLHNLRTWPLQSGVTPALAGNILRVFNSIIMDVYGYDDNREPSKKLCGSLEPAGKYLVDTFIISSDAALVASGLISNLLPSKPYSDNILASYGLEKDNFCTAMALQLITTLLTMGMLFHTPVQHFEQQILLTVPLLVRVYASEDSHKGAIVQLFSSLVQRAGMSNSRPISLLGHLGIDNAQNFLAELSSLGGARGDIVLEVKTWDLASAAIKGGQQWLASFLLTGDTPKSSLKREEGESGKTATQNTLLATALEAVSATQALHNPRGLAMLRFVLHAQNFRPGATHKIHSHADFLTSISDYVAALTSEVSKGELDESNQVYASALIAEILAMYLHNMRLLGDISFLKTLIPKLSFYRENAGSIPSYNSSLHSNLGRNFDKKFPGCELTSFKRLVGPSTFGRDYCYDLSFAAKVLSFHQTWKGLSDGGFEEELGRANINLSLVESQVMLLTSWKSLCVELCHNLTEGKTLQKQMVNVVNHCLVANINSNLPEAVFEHLLQTRAELAMVILQRLVNIRSEVPSMKALLSTVWEAIRASGQNFEIAFVGSLTAYYRSLLRILLLALRPHTQPEPSNAGSKEAIPESSQVVRERTVPILLEIATEVVAKGFRSLCAQVHEEGAPVLPSDFGLVTSVLQNILCIHGISEAYVQLTLQLCDTGIHRFALALFSWSDRLATDDGDPVFGELSMSFLRELSSIPPMAEYLATEGVLSQVFTAAILSHLRETDNAVPHPRLRRIWSSGVLPFVLNVLVAVGNPIALEITAFMNSFPAQLKRVETSLDSAAAAPTRADPLAGSITLQSAVELHTLSMISRALDIYRESPSAVAAGSSLQELQWDRVGVKEDLEAWIQGKRAALRTKIMPSSDNEVAMQKMPPLGLEKGGEEGCDDRLEECVIRELKGALTCLGGDS